MQVIHYEIPNDPETFVHRSGRTGRAGKDGTAILMYSDNQVRTMRLIERDVGCKFERIGAPHLDDVLRASGETATQVIQRVHPEVAQIFMPTAEALLEEQGVHALAAALAHLAGFTQLPASRSLLTHEEVQNQCFTFTAWGIKKNNGWLASGTVSHNGFWFCCVWYNAEVFVKCFSHL